MKEGNGEKETELGKRESKEGETKKRDGMSKEKMKKVEWRMDNFQRYVAVFPFVPDLNVQYY